jgi:hypothetical protein
MMDLLGMRCALKGFLFRRSLLHVWSLTPRKTGTKEMSMKRLGFGGRVLLLSVLATSPIAAVAKVIPISDIDALYAAVNNLANVGATLVLRPGTYVLSATDSSNVVRPNGGRIELQPNMSIMGVEGDREAVVIDASGLPASSFPQTNGPNAAIRMGLGHNALEWLSVRDAVNAQANIDAGLHALDPNTPRIEVAHVASSGGLRGLEIINFGPQDSDLTIEADVTDSYFFGNILGTGEGIRAGSFVGAVGGTVNIRMSGNMLWGNLTGRSFEDSRAENSTINILSFDNRSYGNQTGTIIFAGISSNNTRADGNTVNFEAIGDEFFDNTTPSTLDQGGLLVIASENASTVSGGGSNNTANIRLFGCQMFDNVRSDLTVIGARSPSASLAPLSQDNHVTIEIFAIGGEVEGSKPVEVFANTLVGGVPGSQDYGNSVRVIQW